TATPMISLVARSEFARANFQAAADAYRRMIEKDAREDNGPDANDFQTYAEALGCLPQHAESVRQFQSALRLFRVQSDDFAALGKIELAGLMIMAGDDSQARALTASEPAQSFAPERLSRLAWWYYRAGKYDAAVTVLQ